MQKNDGTLVLQPTLTEIGKKRLLENRFKISKFALSDDGVNYKLLDDNIIDPELAVKRTPVLSVWKDSSFNLNNKLVHDGDYYLSEKDFNPSTVVLGEPVQVHPNGFGSAINFPRILSEDGTTTIQYYLTNSDISSLKKDIEIFFNSSAIQGDFVSATISESKFFDIYLPENSVNIDTLRRKNFDDAFISSDERTLFPKTVNVFANSSVQQENKFAVHYKGNFRYDRLDTERYETTITLMEEETGRFQKIKLQIIPTSRQTEE